MEKSNILFVMPALRTPDYTQLAYRSFKDNSSPVHDIRIGLDLDVEEDKEFYRREGIPFDVFHGWGHWTMACYYVKQIIDQKLDFQYIGLVHNDMVFGYNWLAPFDVYDHPAYDRQLYCFNQENPEHNKVYGSTIETFDLMKYREDTRATFDENSKDITHAASFLPWVMSIDAFMTTFVWLTEGDAGIWQRRDYTPVQFQTRVWHFMNIAVSKHRADYLNNQTTRNNWDRHIHDLRFRDLLFYLYENTPWSKDALTGELYRLAKGISV
jgi:hypothetical protein